MPPRFNPDALPLPDGPEMSDPRARLANLRERVDNADPRMIADRAINAIRSNPNMSNSQAIMLLRQAADLLAGITDRSAGPRRFAALQSEGRVLDRLAPRNALAFERLNNGAIIHRDQNFIEYQTTAEQLARCGWRLARIHGHSEVGEARFDSMWIRSPMGSAPFFTAHDMTEEGYLENRAKHLSLGYIETMVSQYEVNGEPRYWAVWEQGLRTPNGTMPAGFIGGPEFGATGIVPPGFEGGRMPPGFGPGPRPGIGFGTAPSSRPGFGPGLRPGGPGFGGPVPPSGGPVRFPPGFRG
jgi:hypothetical protein